MAIPQAELENSDINSGKRNNLYYTFSGGIWSDQIVE
jgi:hypothetical protein